MADSGSNRGGKASISGLSALRSLTRTMMTQVELDVFPVFDESLRLITEVVGTPWACLHLYDSDDKMLKMVHYAHMDPARVRAWARLKAGGGSLPARAFSKMSSVNALGDDAPKGLGGAVSVVVAGADIALGAISTLWPAGQSPRLDKQVNEFLETAAGLVGLAIEHAGLVSELVDNMNELMALKAKEEQRAGELAELNQKLKQANRRLEELSITDGLTGLYNRRYFMQRLEQEVLRSRRDRRPVCLVMADLDHFKNINDTLGHQAGDEALVRFAGWLQNSVREIDLVGRYGGEEFVVALVNCGLNPGRKVGEKIRAAVERLSPQPPFDSCGGFTVSLGLAEINGGMSPEELIEAADKALYRAKELGRNRLEVAELQ